MRIGVLALQGAFAEHVDTLDAIGVEGVEVRLPSDLEGVSGLILPGGESTTMRRLIERWGLREPILDLAATGAPIFGTCAGMILLATRDRRRRRRRSCRCSTSRVRRNAFGRQLDSFEAELTCRPRRPARPRRLHPGPRRRAVGPGVDVLARLDDGRIVAVRERNVIATAFHPELAGETALPPARGDDGRRARRPGRGLRPPAPPDPPREGSPDDRDTAAGRRPRGKVRAARLTDLAALGELSRLCQTDGAGTRSLGPARQRPADRRLQPLPPAARRVPAARPPLRLRGRAARRRPGPRRARDLPRRLDDRRARRDRRARPAQAPATSGSGSSSRSSARARSAAPPGSTSPAPTRTATSSSSCRPASPATARRASSTGRRHAAARALDRRRPPPRPDPRRAGPLDALALMRLYAAVTPPPSSGWRASGSRTGSARAPTGACPAAQPRAAPPLRRRRGLRPGGRRDGAELDGFVQVGVAKRGPAPLPPGPRAARRSTSRPSSSSAWASSPRAGTRRDTPESRRHRPRANLRVTDRPPPRGGRLRAIATRHAAHEGNARPRRRAGPGAGRRAPLEVTRGS